MSNYQICDHCADLREAEEFEAAGNCRYCKGKGFVRKPETYFCNGCGESLCIVSCGTDELFPAGLIEQTVSGGYSSTHLFDTTNYTFSLCELCLRKLFNTFAIPPAISFYMGGHDDFDYAKDLEAYNFRMWEKSGGQKEKLKSELCTSKKDCPNKAEFQELLSGELTDCIVCSEHKTQQSRNSLYVPIDLVKDISRDWEKRSIQDKHRLVDAYLLGSEFPKDKIIYFKHFSYPFRDLVGKADIEETGGFFAAYTEFGVSSEWTEKLLEKFRPTKMSSGILYSGSSEDAEWLKNQASPVWFLDELYWKMRERG